MLFDIDEGIALTFAIDFDGTCVTHEFPEVGREIGAEPVLRELVKAGHNLILYTMRSDEDLSPAIEWFKERDIPLVGINENSSQKRWTSSPKIYAHFYIDDAALGVPLVMGQHERPYVDWGKVWLLLKRRGVL